MRVCVCKFHNLIYNQQQTKLVTPTGAVSLIGVQSIAVVTATAETADGVSTSSVRAESVYHPALVYVCDKRGKMSTSSRQNPDRSCPAQAVPLRKGLPLRKSPL